MVGGEDVWTLIDDVVPHEDDDDAL